MSIKLIDNLYVKNAERTWTIGNNTYCLIRNDAGEFDSYSVRVLCHTYGEDHWLDNGPWETESGSAWAILDSLDEGDQE